MFYRGLIRRALSSRKMRCGFALSMLRSSKCNRDHQVIRAKAPNVSVAEKILISSREWPSHLLCSENRIGKRERVAPQSDEADVLGSASVSLRLITFSFPIKVDLLSFADGRTAILFYRLCFRRRWCCGQEHRFFIPSGRCRGYPVRSSIETVAETYKWRRMQ